LLRRLLGLFVCLLFRHSGWAVGAIAPRTKLTNQNLLAENIAVCAY
jgi:hypothetical protein